MDRRKLLVLMLLGLTFTPSLVQGAPRAANPPCSSLAGTFIFTDFVFTSPTTATAKANVFVNGQVVGDASAQYFNIEQKGQGVTHMNGQHEIRLPGGTLYTFDEIRLQSDKKNPGWGRANSRLYIIGGTGVYEGATGVLHTHGEVNLFTFEGGIDFKGLVCAP